MPSTKRYLTVLALGSVLCLCGTLAATNGHEKEDHGKVLRTTFSGDGMMVDPCPGADPVFFNFEGTNIARFREGKRHASIHIRFLGKGVDQPIKTFLHAKADVDPVDLKSLKTDDHVTYDIPFDSIWVQKGAHSWTFSAYMHVYVDKGGIFATQLFADPEHGFPFSLQCTDGIAPNAPEHKFNHDNDEDDDQD